MRHCEPCWLRQGLPLGITGPGQFLVMSLRKHLAGMAPKKLVYCIDHVVAES